MRAIKHPFIEQPVTSSADSVPVLVLEKPSYYRSFIRDLIRQIEGEGDFVVYSKNGKMEKLSSDAELITDLLNIPFDEKKISTTIQKNLVKNVTEAHALDFNKLNAHISSFLSTFLLDFDIPLTFDDDFSLSSLLKATNVRPVFLVDDYMESLVTRIKAVSVSLGKDFFILVGLHQVLSQSELNDFYHELSLCQIDLLSIESREPKSHLSKFEKLVVIDEDLCEILK